MLLPLQIAERTLIALTSISALVLAASGLTIIFGLMGVINLAHGALLTVGAYTAFAVQDAGLPAWLGIVLAPVVVGLVGLVLEESLVKRLYERPLDTLLATWGASILLREGVQILFGTSQKNVEAPLSGSVSLAGATYPAYWLAIIGVTAAVMTVVVLLFKYTDIGIMALAVIENREMAAAVGINTGLSDKLTFAFGSALAGLAGAIIAPLLSVSANMGLPWLANSFLVVIVGGVGTFSGTVAGGILLGGLDQMFRAALGGLTSVAQAAVLVVALVVIRYRPNGIIPAEGNR